MQREIKKKTILYGATAILLAICIGALCIGVSVLPLDIQPIPQVTQALETFSSYEEIRNFLITRSGTYTPYASYSPFDAAALRSEGYEAALISPNPVFSGTDDKSLQSSSTNIQVAGVDEADTVKNEGRYIYVVSNSKVFILKAYPPEEAEIVASMSFGNSTYPWEIFINEDRLVVLGSQYTMPKDIYWNMYLINVKTFANVYDVSDKTHPVLLTNFTISGSYFNSRMIGDYVYFVVSQPAYIIYDTVILPKLYTTSGMKEITPCEIYYSDGTDSYYVYSTIVAINIQETGEEPNHLTLMIGGTSHMYVSLQNIYVTYPKVTHLTHESQTAIYRIRVERRELEEEAHGTVAGQVLGQFSMDEYNGYFRIATETRDISWVPSSNLFVLDMNLTVVGSLTGIAVGERFDSARFIENRCYLSTSVIQQDPFFVIDVENATEPKILGYLKIPGFTRYLHPYDADHIIGIGIDSSNVKITLFDVSNVSSPSNVSQYAVNAKWSYSLVLDDHKAFLFDYNKSLLAIPVSLTQMEYDPLSNDYSYWSWQGLYVLNISLSGGITLKGNITHQQIKESYWSSNYVTRSLYIEDVLYTVSESKIMLNYLNDLAPIKDIPLA
ncbi:beta-propeller domain-containing protein [Candidatus Bathyarchaeota archaeon]|nr:beta-propeller domain-containing protein [Candidatus Bathyarchaeota archaeon]